MNEYATSFGNSAADALPEKRAQFIRKTYLLLAAAILAFIAVEAFLFITPAAGLIATVIFSGGAIGWLLVLGLFMGVSFLANRWATSETSKVTQYFGLGIFIVAEAVIFVPLIMISTYYAGDASVLLKAGIVTLGLMWLRMAKVAKAKLAEGGEDKAFYEAKLVTARYYAERYLPDAGALRRKLEAGSEAMMALGEDAFATAA